VDDVPLVRECKSACRILEDAERLANAESVPATEGDVE
jgi:hypothetical protein